MARPLPWWLTGLDPFVVHSIPCGRVSNKQLHCQEPKQRAAQRMKPDDEHREVAPSPDWTHSEGLFRVGICKRRGLNAQCVTRRYHVSHSSTKKRTKVRSGGARGDKHAAMQLCRLTRLPTRIRRTNTMEMGPLA